MTISTAYLSLRQQAMDSGIEPFRCPGCGRNRHTGVSWHTSQDDGTDPDYVGYQCRNCGRTVGLKRATILRRIRDTECRR